ncbi:MAG: carbon-nitrogen hydrolase [Deltaproteobacteria bacterium]|nr:carbon-nitrogen hydrolase [Deltaproteobacteria bacterium]
MSTNITLALLQMSCSGKAQENLDKVIQLAREAAKKGAQIISTQELFTNLYFCQENNEKYFVLAEEIPGKTTEVLGKLAKELGVVLVASLFEKGPLTLPSPPRGEGKNIESTKDQVPSPLGGEGQGEGLNYYNTACVLDADGTFLGKYRKVHIPNDLENYYSELYYFKPGDLGYPIFKTRFGNIGVQVCWDQWYPEGARSLALQGAEIIFYPTAIGWPSDSFSPNSHRPENNRVELGLTEYDAWFTIQRAHAIANTVFIAACNRTGLENHLSFWGGSFIADPLGRVLAKASHDHEEILMATCDLSEIERVRKDWPFLTCRRPEEYRT